MNYVNAWSFVFGKMGQSRKRKLEKEREFLVALEGKIMCGKSD